MTQVDVVLPVLDEVDAIPWVLERMPPDVRPIVVDNGSTDGSADLARSLGRPSVITRTATRIRRRVLRGAAPGHGADRRVHGL